MRTASRPNLAVNAYSRYGPCSGKRRTGMATAFFPSKNLRHCIISVYVLLIVAAGITGISLVLNQPVLLDASGEALNAEALQQITAIDGIALDPGFFSRAPRGPGLERETAWWQTQRRVAAVLSTNDSVTIFVGDANRNVTIVKPDIEAVINDVLIIYGCGLLYLIGGLALYFRHATLTGFLLATHLLGGPIALLCTGTISMRLLSFPILQHKMLMTLLVIGNIGFLAGTFFVLRFPHKKRLLCKLPSYLPPLLYIALLLHGMLFLMEAAPFSSLYPVSVALNAAMLLALAHSFATEKDGFIKTQIGILLLIIGTGLAVFYALYWSSSLRGPLSLDPTDISLLSITTLFAFAAIFESVTLYQQKQAVQEQSQTERDRFREELHDNMLNRLANISLLSDAALKTGGGETVIQKVTAIKKEAHAYSQYARELLWITDDTCTWNDFCSQLRSIGYDLTGAHALEFELTFDETPQPRFMPLLVKVCIYKIFTEAVVNTLKHAGASRIHVELRLEQRHALFHYRDNGAGLKFTAAERGHYGLTHMQRRAQEAGGVLHIGNDPNGGATLALKVQI